jgi:histidine triad (HIT) family protein
MKTLFSKIIDRELNANIIYEDDSVIVIKDIHPKAPIHWLIIPKIPIPTFQDLQKEHFGYLLAMTEVIQKLAKEHSLEKGYRLVVNNGPDAGQSVFHLHIHFLAQRAHNHDF